MGAGKIKNGGTTMSVVEKFKENKKVMKIKMEQASKMADDAANEFAESIMTLVKDASVEEIKELIELNDKTIDTEDKLFIIAAYAESHDNIGGIAIIGMK